MASLCRRAALSGRGSTPEAHVIFADNDLVVVDKPAGLVVHPGAGNQEGTLVQQLLRLFPDIAMAGPAGDRPGIVQRLDKGTSGLLVVARTAAAREGLVAQLSARSVERRYLASSMANSRRTRAWWRRRSAVPRLALEDGRSRRGPGGPHALLDDRPFAFAPPREPGVLPPRDRAHPSGTRPLRRHRAPGIRRRTLFEAQAVGRGAESGAGAGETVAARVGPRLRSPGYRRFGPLYLDAAG